MRREEPLPVESFRRREKKRPAEESQQEEQKAEVRRKEERSARGSEEIEDAAVRGFTKEDVDRLIDEAQAATFPCARESAGAAAGHSQTFLRRLQRLIKDFRRSNLEPRFKSLGTWLWQMMKICREDQACRPSPMAGNRNLFPLPVSICPEVVPDCSEFLPSVAAGLNDMHGSEEPEAARANPTSVQALKNLGEAVEAAEIMNEKLPNMDFGEFLQHRKVDYRGEEVQVARDMNWNSIRLSLPQEVGTLFLRDFCEAGVLHFIDNFTDYLLPQEQQIIGKTPRVMVEEGEWPKIARGLIDHGICSIIKESEIYHLDGKILLNGMFSVSKQEFQEGVEICRLIMNLKPVNQLSMALTGDTGSLPSATSLGTLFLDDDQKLLTCSEDIRCFFYLFRVPEAWKPYLCFSREIPQELVPRNFGEERCFLTSNVLPMGYLNSVGIAQHVHRRVVQACMGSLRPPLGPQHELRRDRLGSQADQVFRVYLDNFDLLCKQNPDAAQLLKGTPGDIVMKLRDTYHELGLPRHPKKGVENQLKAEVQGAWVDGEKGTICAKPSKAVKYVGLALDLLERGACSQRELQVLGGGFVYIAMFRRPLLSTLNHIWTMIVDMEGTKTWERWTLRRQVASEVVRFLCLLPLARMDLRLKIDPIVTASDASTQGGGICVSRGLTPYGSAAAAAQVRGEIPEEEDLSQILSIGLFDGIGALRTALDVLRLPVAGHISVECNPKAKRVVEAAFPDAILIDNVEDINEETCKAWALRFSSVTVVLLGGGPPCQGVSGLNCDRKGALKDSRSSLFRHVPRIVALCRIAFPWAQIHFLAENVASMDAEDCETMNEGYECEAWYIDAHQLTPCHRPRLYWISWHLFSGPGSHMLEGSDGRLPIAGEVKLEADIAIEKFLDSGCRKFSDKPFPTFTTSRPSPHPLRRPAGLKTCQAHELTRWTQDCHRFPPYQYKDENCVVGRTGELRPPNVMEREVCLGFPVDYTKQCLPKSQHDTIDHQDSRLTLLGNSWSVPVIAWILSCLFTTLGFMDEITVQEIVNRITPGEATYLPSLLLRPPLGHSTKTLDCSDILVRKLCGSVSLKGEDILLQAGTDIPVHYHRLRSSIPAKLWRWKDVAGWKWCGNPEHINALELRSVLTTIKWRVEQMKQSQTRCIHLVDSLVVLHSLTRGRSSSRKLRRTMMKVSAYLLCSNLQPVWAYVDTKQNPADRPSRRFVKKKWVKKR